MTHTQIKPNLIDFIKTLWHNMTTYNISHQPLNSLLMKIYWVFEVVFILDVYTHIPPSSGFTLFSYLVTITCETFNLLVGQRGTEVLFDVRLQHRVEMLKLSISDKTDDVNLEREERSPNNTSWCVSVYCRTECCLPKHQTPEYHSHQSENVPSWC